MVKWACLCVVLHSFVSSLLSLNEVLAALDNWRFGDSKGPRVDLLFLKQIFAWLKTQNLFLSLCFTCHSLESFMNIRMRYLNDPQLVKVPLGWHQAFISWSYGGGGASSWLCSASELYLRIVSSLKTLFPSHRMKWQSKPLYWSCGWAISVFRQLAATLYVRLLVLTEAHPLHPSAFQPLLLFLVWRQLCAEEQSGGRHLSQSVTFQQQETPLPCLSWVLHRLQSWSESAGGHCNLRGLSWHSLYRDSDSFGDRYYLESSRLLISLHLGLWGEWLLLYLVNIWEPRLCERLTVHNTYHLSKFREIARVH